MASGKSNYLEDVVINAYLRTGTVYVSLHTTACTDVAPGTEVAGGGYARQSVTFGVPALGVTSNTDAPDFGIAGSAWGSVVSVAIFDAVSGGNMLYYGDVTPVSIGAGEGARFQVGDITIEEG